MSKADYEYVPRFSFEISEELKARADKLLTNYGVRKAIMAPILNDLLDLIQEHGHIVIGAILDEAVKPSDILPSMARAKKRIEK